MSRPLDGIRILDFTSLLPGPYATMILADLGAEVVRLEAFDRPDLLRELKPQVDGVSVAHAQLNRGKKSLGINLKANGASDLIKNLIVKGGFNIVVEGFRPGVMRSFGLDYETLSEIDSGLIYCSLTGYGQTGPKARCAGHDINYLAESGIASYSGRRATGPSPQGLQIADTAGGSLHAVVAVLSAVIQRSKTGRGDFCDLSITDASLSLNALFGASFLQFEHDPGLEDNDLNGAGLYDYYRCADDRYLAFGGIEPKFIAAFLNTLGLSEELERMQRQQLSQVEMKAVKARVQAVILDRPLAHWIERFKPIDACVSPVATFTEISRSEQFNAREMFLQTKTQNGKPLRQIGSPFLFRSHDKPKPNPGGLLAAQSEEILQRYLELPIDAIAALKESGVIVTS